MEIGYQSFVYLEKEGRSAVMLGAGTSKRIIIALIRMNIDVLITVFGLTALIHKETFPHMIQNSQTASSTQHLYYPSPHFAD